MIVSIIQRYVFSLAVHFHNYSDMSQFRPRPRGTSNITVSLSLDSVHKRRKGSLVGGAPWRVRSTSLSPAGSRAEPLVRRSGGRSPPEAESILVIGCPTELANLAPVRENSMFCYGPLVSELGGWAECMVPPNPVIGGPVPPPGSAAYECTKLDCVRRGRLPDSRVNK